MFRLFWQWEEENTEKKNDIVVEIVKPSIEVEEEYGQLVVDILDTSDNIFIIAPVAGVTQGDIDIHLNRTVLTIKWVRNKPEEYNKEDVKVKVSECFWGKFLRNIILPENLALNKISAYMENHILIVTIPKLKFDSHHVKIQYMKGKEETEEYDV